MTHRNRVLAEQIRLVCGHLPFLLGASVATSALTVFVLRSRLEFSFLLTWFAGVIILSLLRLALYWHYRVRPTTPQTARERKWMLCLAFAVSSLIWGVLGYAAVNPGDTIAGVYIVMLFTGIVAASMPSLSNCLPVFCKRAGR